MENIERCRQGGFADSVVVWLGVGRFFGPSLARHRARSVGCPPL